MREMRGYAVARERYRPKFRTPPRRMLDRLAYDLALAEAPSAELDERLFKAMKRYVPELTIAEFTTNLNDAIRLVPSRWWWHVSHMQAEVIPTCAVKGAESVLSNAGRYDDEGRPVSYTTLIAWERDRSALALCSSLVQALAALRQAAREKA